MSERPPIDTTKLRQLIAEIHPALPWGISSSENEGDMIISPPSEVALQLLTDGKGFTSTRVCIIEETGYMSVEQARRVAALIVHLANNAEAIADELDQLRRENAELKAQGSRA